MKTPEARINQINSITGVPNSGKNALGIASKSRRIMLTDWSGKTYQTHSVPSFVRENLDLFDSNDTVFKPIIKRYRQDVSLGSKRCRAIAALQELVSGKMETWKGWSVSVFSNATGEQL
jgi:hypothetical protein